MIESKLFIRNISLVILLTVLLTAGVVLLILSKQSSVEHGQLDISGYDFPRQGSLTLDGEWEFYPGEFLPTQKLADADIWKNPDHFIRVPGTWNSYAKKGKPLPGFGCATYRLTVTGVASHTQLALKVPPQSTAYKLYLDDKLVAQNGSISANKKGFVPQYRPQTVNFTTAGREFMLTMHIANFTYARGGMWYVLTLGTPAQIAAANRLITYRDAFLLGNYFLIFLFCMALYVIRQANRSVGYFALLCIAAAARVMLYGNYILAEIISSLHLIVVIDYLTLLGFPILILLLTDELFPHTLAKPFIRIMLALNIIFVVIVLVLPVACFTRFVYLFEINALFIGIYTITSLLVKNRANFRWVVVFGIACLLFCAIHDVLYQNCLIADRLELSPVGFYIMVLMWTLVLGRNYAEALTSSENALLELKNSIAREQQAELSFLHSQIKPHFLYNALSAIANVCTKDGRRAENLILNLAQFLQTSLDFNGYERITTLEKELAFIHSYIDIEKARFGEKITYRTQIEVPGNTPIPRLIIEPLIENAVRHGITKKKEGGEVWLIVSAITEGIHIEVGDNGIGMDPEGVSTLLDTENKRRGVGVRNIHARLMKLYGAGLTIESTPNVGTKVSFMIKEEQSC